MNQIAKNIHRGIIALALSFSFMFFVYAPLEVYLGNTTEFWFDITHLLPIVMVCFVISVAVLILILELLYKFLYPVSKNAKRAFYVIYLVLLMTFIGLYIQGNYIPRDYGVLDGRTIDWASYSSYATMSVLLWGAVLVIGIFMWIKLRKQIFKIGQVVSAAVFMILTVALISLALNADNIIEDNSMVVTDEGQWILSENKNIYVLVLDTFDAEYLRILLEEDKDEYAELLKDFTFYSNATGGYPTTKGSIPLILTGEWYENDVPWEQFINQSGLELLEELKANNYSIGVYADKLFLNKSEEYYENVSAGKYEVANSVAFTQNLYKLIMFEYMPHQLKRAFWIDTSEFESEKAWSSDASGQAYTMSDEHYYKTMCEDGFELISGTNCFRFVHLWGMHPPYEFGEDVIEDGKEYTYRDTAKGSINEIKALLSNIKEEGVYDNTAIMIMADHGGGELASELNCNPLLLVKGFDEHHEFVISENPISWKDIYPTLLSWASGTEQDNAVWNISDEERERRFLYYILDESGQWDYMPIMTEYSIMGNVADKSAVINKTGRQFLPGHVEKNEVDGLILPDGSEQDPLTENPYKIEIPINSDNNQFKDMYVSGLGDIEINENGQQYAWTKGYYTHFKLNPEGEQNFAYTFSVNFDEIYNADVTSDTVKTIYATVNGERVETDKITESYISFDIPKETLKADMVDVMIFYPYFESDGEDGKVLAITSVTLEQKFPTIIKDKLSIDFNADGNFKNMISDGWNAQEQLGIWSQEDANITFMTDNDSDLIVKMKYHSFDCEIPTVVKLNGEEVFTLRENCEGEFILPKEYLNSTVQILEFMTEGALSPKDVGMNSDIRKMGIYVQNIIIVDSKEFLPIDISFKREPNVTLQYMVSGFSGAESWGTWMVGKEAIMSFFVPDVQEDLLLTMECAAIHGTQNVLIYANDVLIAEYVAEIENKSILIPKECMREDGCLNLRFELPNAYAPQEKGESPEVRELAIGIAKLRIDRIQE